MDIYFRLRENFHQSIESLEFWTKVQPTGVRSKDIVKWAREVLRLYGGISSVG